MRLLPLFLFFLLVLACCTSSRTIGQPTLYVRDDTIQLVQRDKVDILFMIDDSPSMAPKQAALRANFPELVTRIQTLATNGAPASFHIGVVDSDLGAGRFTLNNGQCHPDGDGGKLRTGAAATDPSAPGTCASLQLGNGESFIDYDSATGASNLGTFDLTTAFGCLSSVGSGGCGFEHQLESVYRTLTTPSLNPGFLRDDALLIVVWLTDEDDCSAPPDSGLFDPSSAGVAEYGVLHSFRCTQFGVTCGGSPLTGAALSSTDCAPAVGGPLFDVARYSSLFGAPRASGGVKDDPSDVLLISIAAPPTPVAVTVTSPCEDQPNTASCPILGHSCVSSSNGIFFGDPGVRLHAVMSSTVNGIEASICDGDYTLTMDAMADAMAARMRAGCLPGAIVDPSDPGCSVTLDGKELVRCTVEGALPCWDVVGDTGCPARPTPAGASRQQRFVIEGAAPDATLLATCPLYEPMP
jgi:hypothetical protein